MQTVTIKITITKQDWDNFSSYCENTNISKAKAISMILNTWLEKYGILHDNISGDVEVDLGNYEHKQLDFKYDYKEGNVQRKIRISPIVWETYIKFCNKNNYYINSLLNIIINSFLYPDFPSIEADDTAPVTGDNEFQYIFNDDGSLKYKASKKIKGNQAHIKNSS